MVLTKMVLTKMMKLEVKRESDFEVAYWMQQQHQIYENYGKTEQAFDSQLPLCWFCYLQRCWYCSSSSNDLFEGWSSLDGNGFIFPTLPQSPQVPNPSYTPVAAVAGCGIGHHSYMEIPFVACDQYQSSLDINLADQNNSTCSSSGSNLNHNPTWEEFQKDFSSPTVNVDHLQEPPNTGYSFNVDYMQQLPNTGSTWPSSPSLSQVSDAHNYSFAWTMSPLHSSTCTGTSPVEDSLLPEIAMDLKKRKRDSSRQRRAINGFSCFTSDEKRQKLQHPSASPLHDKLDFNSKIIRAQKEIKKQILFDQGRCENGCKNYKNAKRENQVSLVKVKVEPDEGEIDDGLMYDTMSSLDEFFPKDFNLKTLMLELLPKDLHFLNDYDL